LLCFINDDTAKVVQHFKKSDVQLAVRFILSDVNVQKILWGTNKVMVHGEEVEMPKLIRKKIAYMYQDYMETVPEDQRISNESFRKIAQALTATDQIVLNLFQIPG
jgi:hypothetical protein